MSTTEPRAENFRIAAEKAYLSGISINVREYQLLSDEEAIVVFVL